jgi:glycosyltransferase involved in cell wall biosynthesis
MKRDSILLVAYQCGPEMGSVSQIGWEWYSRLSSEYAVTLVTHIRNRPALEKASAPLGDSEVMFIDTEWFAGPLYRFAKWLFPHSEYSVFLVSSLDYFVFDLVAFFKLRQVKKTGRRWSLLHRVTPVTLSAPTWLVRLGMPTVIGPLNSGLKNPQGFDDILKQESTWLNQSREIGNLFDGLLGSTRLASRLLVASRATLEGIASHYRGRCQMMIENGVELTRFVADPWPTAPSQDHPLDILFVGRLIPFKGLDMLLQAVARLSSTGFPVRLKVVGDGPMAANWKVLAGQLGLHGKVHFTGNLPLNQVAQHMRDCHVFCLPSIRESGGAVLLEAMACARPVIALNFGGPGEIVDSEVGSLVALRSPEQVVDDLVQKLTTVFTQPELWRQRGEVGRQRVASQYSWPAKISAVKRIYEQVIRERGPYVTQRA